MGPALAAVHRLLIAVASLVESIGSRALNLSSCSSQALDHRLNSCGVSAQLLHGMWDPPGPGIKPMSLARGGAFFTTEKPGNPENT